jgi:hypothetical protein
MVINVQLIACALALLGKRGPVLLPTLHSVRLDRARDRNHSPGVQNCHDRLVIVAHFDD